MKWFICAVITDSHLIAWRWNRTSNPQERIFPSKWSHSSVMWDLYIADGKGERFIVFAGRITYFTDVFHKAQLLPAKKEWFICDVITDCHLITARRNRTIINAQEWIFPSKWSDSSVMSYLYIAHEKGKRFWVHSHLTIKIHFFYRHVGTVTLVTMQPICDDMLTTSKNCMAVHNCERVLCLVPGVIQ